MVVVEGRNLPRLFVSRAEPKQNPPKNLLIQSNTQAGRHELAAVVATENKRPNLEMSLVFYGLTRQRRKGPQPTDTSSLEFPACQSYSSSGVVVWLLLCQYGVVNNGDKRNKEAGSNFNNLLFPSNRDQGILAGVYLILRILRIQLILIIPK